MEGGSMIVLNNGATPIRWEVGFGGAGERRYIGKVIALWGNDPYVVWTMASDDGTNWDCFWGHYVNDIGIATQLYHGKAFACGVTLPPTD